jgi:hypothetical protein
MSRIEVLEAAHRAVAPFYAPVILFHHVVLVLTGADVRAKFLGDSLGIAGVPVSGDLLGLDLGDRPGGAEERLGGGLTLPRQTGPDVKFDHHLEEGHDEEDAEAVHGRVQSCGGCPAG